MNMWNNQVDRLVEYFKAGEKKSEEAKVGVELEHLVLDKKTYQTVPYLGPNGIRESLEDLEEKGWKGSYEDSNILGALKGEAEVSTEPALQFEVSFEAKKDLRDIDKAYVDFIKDVSPVFNEKGQILVAMGYQPVTKISEIQISPKKRYSYMYEYFKKRGTHAHNMMKGTAAVQVVIDYLNEEDFVRKFRLGNALSPILYNIFDNAYFFEGEKYQGYNLRQHIWENTDSDRSGVPEFAFDKDLSYRKYAEYILNNDIIFTDKDGVLSGTGGKLFKDIFNPETATKEEIYHALSIVFPDLRLKHYLEFRMMDALPYPMNMAAVALVKGLMYVEINLDILASDFDQMTYQDFKEGRLESKEKGIRGVYFGKTFLEWADHLFNLAYDGLSEEERKYLDPINQILDSGKAPKEIFGEIYQTMGIDAAMELVKVEV